MPKPFSFALAICIVSLPLPESCFVQVSKSLQPVWKGGHLFAECSARYLGGMICRSSEHVQQKPEANAFQILKHRMLNTQKTGHDVSGWTSNISQDFLILIFTSLLCFGRIQIVPFLLSVDIIQMQVTWEVSTPHNDERMRVTC